MTLRLTFIIINLNVLLWPRAEHGCRSLWVTCGFTHGNTCKDPDPQVQVTCSHRSLRVQVRDWHGFEKPAGKCRGLARGTGTGWAHPTLAKPVPAQRVDGLPRKFKLRSKRDQRPVARSFNLHHHPLLCVTASKTRK
jgi:hypothetical protein